MRKSKGYSKASASLLALLFAAGLLIGGLVSFYINFQEINSLSAEVAALQSQVSALHGGQEITYQNFTVYQNSTALVEIYSNVRDSVVLVQGTTNGDTVQGSGFVYNFSNTMVVITNFHVVYDTSGLSVTFPNGKGY